MASIPVKQVDTVETDKFEDITNLFDSYSEAPNDKITIFLSCEIIMTQNLIQPENVHIEFIDNGKFITGSYTYTCNGTHNDSYNQIWDTVGGGGVAYGAKMTKLRLEWFGGKCGTKLNPPTVDSSPALQKCVDIQATSKQPIKPRRGIYNIDEGITIRTTNVDYFCVQGLNKSNTSHSTIFYCKNIEGFTFTWSATPGPQVSAYLGGITFDGSNGYFRSGCIVDNWGSTWKGAFSSGNQLLPNTVIENCWIGCTLALDAILIDATNIYFSEFKHITFAYAPFGLGLSLSAAGSVETTNNINKCYFIGVRQGFLGGQSLDCVFDYTVFEACPTAGSNVFGSVTIYNPHFEQIGLDLTQSIVITDDFGTISNGDYIVIDIDGVSYTQYFEIDKNTTLNALATKLSADVNVMVCQYRTQFGELIITPRYAYLIEKNADPTLDIHINYTGVTTGNITFALRRGIATGVTEKVDSHYPITTLFYNHVGRMTFMGGTFTYIQPNTLDGYLEPSGLGSLYGANGITTFIAVARSEIQANYQQPLIFNDTRIVGGGVSTRQGAKVIFIADAGDLYAYGGGLKLVSDWRKADIAQTSIKFKGDGSITYVEIKAGKVILGVDWTIANVVNSSGFIRKDIVDWDGAVVDWQVGDTQEIRNQLEGKPSKYVCVRSGVNPPLWTAGNKALGDTCVPNLYRLRDVYFTVTTPGVSGVSEPSWNTAIGSYTTDGTAVYQCTGIPSKWQSDRPLADIDLDIVSTTISGGIGKLFKKAVRINEEVHRYTAVVNFNNAVMGTFDITVANFGVGVTATVRGNIEMEYGTILLKVVIYNGYYNIEYVNDTISAVALILHREDTVKDWRY